MRFCSRRALPTKQEMVRLSASPFAHHDTLCSMSLSTTCHLERMPAPAGRSRTVSYRVDAPFSDDNPGRSLTLSLRGRRTTQSHTSLSGAVCPSQPPGMRAVFVLGNGGSTDTEDPGSEAGVTLSLGGQGCRGINAPPRTAPQPKKRPGRREAAGAWWEALKTDSRQSVYLPNLRRAPRSIYWIEIWRGLLSSAFGTVIFRTPSSYAASMLSS